MACRTPPPTLPIAMFLNEIERILEGVLFDTKILIKGSFEASLWKFGTNESLIISSANQDDEK